MIYYFIFGAVAVIAIVNLVCFLMLVKMANRGEQ